MTPSSPQLVSCNDKLLQWSPYTWRFSGSGTDARAEATLPGAYLKANFEGSASFGVLIDGSGNVGCQPSSMPWVEYSVDHGPFKAEQLTQTGGVYLLPLATGLDTAKPHTVEFYFRAAGLSQKRWTTSLAHLRLAGVQIGNGGKLQSVPRREKVLVGFGDSITEGVGTERLFSNWSDVSMNNSRLTWVPVVASALDAEYGQLGSSGLGFVQPRELPPLIEGVWDHFDANHPRFPEGKWVPEPDYIFCNLGTNDPGHNITANYVQWLTEMRKACPDSLFFCIVPPLGVHKDEVKAAVEARNKAGDAKTYLIDTTPLAQYFHAGSASAIAYDGVHPSTYGDALLGALIAVEAQKVLNYRQ